ncbi:TPA: TIGR01906 family membrane protein [Streptococcus suis]|nr:TIGR01906 family membrane protein [Streptococcus suis]NQM20806.1 TIGR01906 family membrane protein [Streptococcus suis]HEL1606517.1 TIGR01906 family membrane protein [Streptococcus suis]HEL2505002.1 TIGR01906 family membrane protein [Streptococcus suis]HEM2844720.1 TIGR01906 family membrane protein [Streptococcus suis]
MYYRFSLHSLTFGGNNHQLTPLYAFDIDYLNIPKYVGLSKEQILENYRILLTYLNIPWFLALDMPDFPSSASGLFHFFEVKKLFMLDYLILIFSGMGTLWFVRHLNRRRESWRLLPYFRRGTLIPLAILLALLVSFDTLFVLFHKVFFNNDAWLFNATTDPIILALPAEFFMHSFLLAFGLIEVFLILGYFTTKYRISAPSR